MDTLLIESRINGIKNIDKEIELSFVKKNFGESVFEEPHIKTIYGNNGAGKSAIVHSYDIYRHIVLSSFPFKDQLFSSKLRKLINKKIKEFSIENVFALRFSDGIYRYSHKFILSVFDNGDICFKNEKLTLLNARLSASKTVFEILDGEFIVHPSLEGVELPSREMNRQNSFIAFAIQPLLNNWQNTEEYYAIVSSYVFASNLGVFFGSSADLHLSSDIEAVSNIKREDIKDHLPSAKEIFYAARHVMGETSAWIISQSEEEEYERITKHLSSFLKLLNPSLHDVVPSFSHDGSGYSRCDLRFIYDGYDVDYEFESTGIKKLCALFIAFYRAEKGNVAIIDEVDAGVHDVFLKALVEYFALYVPSQLILTTHHIGLMESIKHLRKSICVLTDDHQIVSWAKNGDYSPSSSYEKGYLHGVPFNLKPFDFANIFLE